APPSADAPPAPTQPPHPPSPTVPCTGTVDGHAVDASTHQPVAAATVRIGDNLVGTTDDAGHFILTEQCPGRLTIIVERDDYKPAQQTVTVTEHASVELRMTSSAEVIEIREKAPPPPEMRSTAVISGAKLENTRGKTFTDALAEVPGVA